MQWITLSKRHCPLEVSPKLPVDSQGAERNRKVLMSQILKIMFPTFSEIADVYWVLLSYFESRIKNA